MATPYNRAFPGTFVILGKQPDGDSVRFVPDDSSALRRLARGYRIRFSNVDQSVQLRFEGIDAPEVHYGGKAQPFGSEARDVLLNWMGFRDVVFTNDTATSASVDRVRGTILSKGVDPNGRPIAYVFREADAPSFDQNTYLRVDERLKDSANLFALREGLAYYTTYSSTSTEERTQLREAARAARDAAKPVWVKDATANFPVDDVDAPNGALILPKLFRRSVDYTKDLQRGFTGSLPDWLRARSSGARPENDQVVVEDRMEVPLSELVVETGAGRYGLAVDLLDIVFVEK